MRRVL